MATNRLIQASILAIALSLAIFVIPCGAAIVQAVSATKEYSNTGRTGLRFDYPADYVIEDFVTDEGDVPYIRIGKRELNLVPMQLNSFEKLTENLKACGMAARGRVILSLCIYDGKLRNYSLSIHNFNIQANTIPIAALDVYHTRWLLDINITDPFGHPYGADRPALSPRQLELEDAMNSCFAEAPSAPVVCYEAVVSVSKFTNPRVLDGFIVRRKESGKYTQYEDESDKLSVADFKTARGLDGFVIRHKHFYKNENVETVRDLLYVFDITKKLPISLIKATPLFHEMQSTDELETVKAIVNSFRIEPAK